MQNLNLVEFLTFFFNWASRNFESHQQKFKIFSYVNLFFHGLVQSSS